MSKIGKSVLQKPSGISAASTITAAMPDKVILGALRGVFTDINELMNALNKAVAKAEIGGIKTMVVSALPDKTFTFTVKGTAKDLDELADEVSKFTRIE